MAELDKLRKEVKQLTAEKLYRHFQDHPPRDPEELQELFRGDDHTPWYLPPKAQATSGGGGDGESGPPGERNSGLSAAMEQAWKDISVRMQMDLRENNIKFQPL